MYRALADAVVLTHLAFVLFVVLGGILVLRWPRVAWLHLPAASWGVVVEWANWGCPLTPLENWLHARAGDASYAGGFVDRYLVPLLYPATLTRAVQLALGAVVLVANVCVYTRLFARAGVPPPAPVTAPGRSRWRPGSARRRASASRPR